MNAELITPWLWFLGPMLIAAAAAVGAASVSMARPRWLTYGYVGILIGVNMIQHGTLDGDAGPSFYSRGGGQLYIPFVVWALLGIWLAWVIRNGFKRTEQLQATNLHKWFYGIAGLFFIHIAVAAVLGESLRSAASPNGIAHLIYGSILFAILVRSVPDEKVLDQFVKLFLSAVLIKGLYGMFRFAVMGGDPANVYANFNNINVRITYFDINDSFLATVAAFMAGWGLLVRRGQLTRVESIFYWMVLLVELAIVVFSYRRSAWGGLVFAAVIFILGLPSRERWKAIVVGVPTVLVGVVVAAGQRLASSNASGGWVGKFFDDVGGRDDILALTERELELSLGMQRFLESPLIGNGTWSRYYEGYLNIPWQDGEYAYQWLHSGVLHIAFKTGLVGLFLVFGMLAAFGWFVFRARRTVPLEWRGVYFSGLAGVLFYLPTLAYGSPMTEYRTTQLIYLSMALPYMVYRAVGPRHP